jgi:hypothetical protein
LIPLRLALLCLASVLIPPAAAGQLFEVLPPEKIPFNYPERPREGARDYFQIAADGVAKCVIVQPAAATDTERATIAAFQTYLRLATGADIQLLRDDEDIPSGLGAIHVGNTTTASNVELQLPNVCYGETCLPNIRGYLVQTLGPQTLVIRGASEKATAHGVVGFLRRYVGVRQYWPGEPGGLGDVIPRRPTLALPQLEWRDWPYFYSAQFATRPFPGKTASPLDFYRRDQTLPAGENYSRWLPPEKYAATNPEYFPLIDGERRPPAGKRLDKGWQPCVSNPEVVRIMAAGVVDYFRENPEAPGINFAINDGGGDCTCDGCRAMDAPGADYSQRLGMSDRYVKFTNQIAEQVAREFPAKWIVYLAYAAARPAPAAVQPHRNVLPVLTVTGNFFEAWDSWMKTGPPHMGLYPHRNGIESILPKFDVHQFARRLRYAVGSGRARVFYGELHPQWPIDDVVPHVVSELLWDPRRDVDALLSDYRQAFYGGAARPMAEFHRVLENGYTRWLREEGEPHWFGHDISSSRHKRALEQFRVLSPKESAGAVSLLAAAAKAAKAEPQPAARIEAVRAMFGLQDLAVQWSAAVLRLRDGSCRSVADANRIVDDARAVLSLSGRSREYIIERLEKPPAAELSLFNLSLRGATPLYEELKSGDPGPEIVGAIANGVEAAETFLREKIGERKAAAWWRRVADEERSPALAAAFRAAHLRATGRHSQNLISDPGFEQTGQRLEAGQPGADGNLLLAREQERRLGLHFWFRNRAASRAVITNEKAHNGRYALLLEHCARARFTRSAPAEPGARYRSEVWVKHNKANGKYRQTMEARLKDGSFRLLSSIPIAAKPGEWQKVVGEVAAPPETSSIFLRLFVEEQAQDARFWIDEVSMERLNIETEPAARGSISASLSAAIPPARRRHLNPAPDELTVSL